MPSAKKRKAGNISTEHGNNNGAAAAAAPPAASPKGKSKTRRLKNTSGAVGNNGAAAGSNGAGAAAAKPAVRRSSLKGPGSAARGLPIHWANANGRPLAYASANFSAASAVAHDPGHITKPSTAGKMFNTSKLIPYLSHPSIQSARARELYLNYVLAFIQHHVSTYAEMVAAIQGLPPDQFTSAEKGALLHKLSRSYRENNEL